MTLDRLWVQIQYENRYDKKHVQEYGGSRIKCNGQQNGRDVEEKINGECLGTISYEESMS